MRNKIRTAFLGFALFSIIFQIFPAKAQEAEPTPDSEKHVKFFIADGPLHTLGSSPAEDPHLGIILFLELDQGWHTYWRVPGDAGLPPRFDWSKSQNVKEVSLGWLPPSRIIENDFQIFGYKDTAIFPITFSVDDPDKETILDISMDVLICNEICIPEKMNVTTKFTPKDIAPDEAALANWLAVTERLPLPHKGYKDLRIENVVLGPDAIVVTAYSDDGFENADLFAIAGDYAFTAAPKIEPDSSNSKRARIVVDKPADVESLAGFLTGKKLEVTLVSGDNAVEESFDF